MDEKFICIPSGASAIIIAYNLGEDDPNDRPMVLSMEAVIGIFNRTILKWNDPLLTSLNPQKELPDAEIIPLQRTDHSGTTYSFTNALCKYDQNFSEKYGNGTKIKWPFHQSFVIASNEHMLNNIAAKKYSIGYSSLPAQMAFRNSIGMAMLINKNGKIVNPSPDSIQSSVLNSQSSKKEFFDSKKGKFVTENELSLHHMQGDKSYPLSTYTYFCVEHFHNDTNNAKGIIHFIEDIQTRLSNSIFGIIALPPALFDYTIDHVKNRMYCDKNYELKCAFIQEDYTLVIILSIVIPFFCFPIFSCIFIFGVLLYLRFKRRSIKRDSLKDKFIEAECMYI